MTTTALGAASRATGSVLGTITTAASSVNSTIITATKAVGMLDRWVSDAATRQAARSSVDMDDFLSILEEEKAMEQAERRLQILEFTKKSPEHEALYTAAKDRISKVLADFKK